MSLYHLNLYDMVMMILKKIFLKTSVPFVGPMIPSSWTSSDISPEYQWWIIIFVYLLVEKVCNYSNILRLI